MAQIYSNQNHISFKSVPRNQNNPFATYNKDGLRSALNNLSKNALKLYLYIGGFQSIKEDYYLSKKDALEKMHMSEQAYFLAKRELKQKGYLIKDSLSNDPNAYIFIECPEGTI